MPPPCPVSPLFCLCSWLLSFQLNGNICSSFEGVHCILDILHAIPYFPHTKTLQGSYLPFLSICTETDNALQIFHLFLQICSLSFSNRLCATVTRTDAHGPHQWAPMPAGMQLDAARETTGRRDEREERVVRMLFWLLRADVSAPVDWPSPHSSVCLQVPVSTSSLQANSGSWSGPTGPCWSLRQQENGVPPFLTCCNTLFLMVIFPEL